jgi:hypothetical protein
MRTATVYNATLKMVEKTNELNSSFKPKKWTWFAKPYWITEKYLLV